MFEPHKEFPAGNTFGYAGLERQLQTRRIPSFKEDNVEGLLDSNHQITVNGRTVCDFWMEIIVCQFSVSLINLPREVFKEHHQRQYSFIECLHQFLNI